MNSTRKEYNTLADTYEKKRWAYAQWTYGKIWERMNFLKTDKKKLRILEIGTWVWIWAEYVLKKFKNIHYTWVDISEEMLAQAEKKIKQCDPKRRSLFRADFTQRSHSEKYDIIISNSVFHFMDYDAALKNLVSHLKKDWSFIIVDWSNTWWFRIKQWRISYILRSWHTAPSFHEMEEYFQKYWLEWSSHTQRDQWTFTMQIIDNVKHP